jgi:3-carboxy-cis,cis-muconate cycloisomerase
VSELPGGATSTPESLATTGSAAWVTAMLDVERALALAAGRVGLAPDAVATAIAAACRPDDIDLDAVVRCAAEQATPVIELVHQLRALVPESARPYVHLAATSQDVVDTAMVLVTRRTLGPVLDQTAAVAELLAESATTYRDAPQVGRTLLQDGAVTTYGAACATRLVAVDDARTRLAAVVRDRLGLQLGGAVGTLAPAGDRAEAYLAAVGAELGLPVPVTAWHTTRGRVGELAGACAVLAGELGGVARDVVLLSQSAIGEVEVASPGGSSAMPGKRNPSSAVLALACAHRVPGLAASLLAGLPQELQRSAGAWQAEWGTVTDLLRLVAGATHHTHRALDGLRVDTGRMRAHVDALVAAGASADPGAAGVFVDRALAAHRDLGKVAS